MGILGEKIWKIIQEKYPMVFNIEEVVFVSYCTDLMASCWDIEPNVAYKKLSDDTNMVKSYLIPNYEVLSKLEDSEIALEIMRQYEKVTSGAMLEE
jgi:hypothetical protein